MSDQRDGNAATSNPTGLSEANRAEARTLKDLWSRVARQHLSGGQACSCGFGGIVFQAMDFEADIVDYLIDAAEKAGHPGASAFIEAAAVRGGGHYSLVALLDALAGADCPDAPPDGIALVLGRLRGTLSSMNEAHEARRFVCD